jgi:hypothetical protein
MLKYIYNTDNQFFNFKNGKFFYFPNTNNFLFRELLIIRIKVKNITKYTTGILKKFLSN